MPTVVHFVGTERTVTVENEYGVVNATLHGSDSGQFTGSGGGSVAIYRSGVT